MTQKEIIIKQIAAGLDYPSVFMGGPSRQNLRKADEILRLLDEEGVLKEGWYDGTATIATVE